MTDQTPPQDRSATENQRELILQKIYLQDASLESPAAPGVFNERWNPTLNVDLDTKAQALQDDSYHIQLRVTVTGRQNERTVLLIEVHQAGIFTVRGLAESELGLVLGAYCPNILFPYAREAVSALVGKAGFPQILLSPVNFESLYHARRQQQQ